MAGGGLSPENRSTRSGEGFHQVSNSSASKTGTNVRAMALAVGLSPLEITTSLLPNAQAGIQLQAGITAAGGDE